MKSEIQTLKIENRHNIGKMGTSGLRQKQEVYEKPFFLEQFTRGIADYFTEITEKNIIAENNKTIILGGDPRKGNGKRIKTIASILAAAGFNIITAENGLASTPAVSHAIRHYKAAGGIILTASHNPFTDVGIKVNNEEGAPILEEASEKIYQLQNAVEEIKTISYEDAVSSGQIKEFNAVELYADLIDSIFDFASMKKKAEEKNITGAFDSMHGAAGPFAREIFLNRLGLKCEMIREEPREDLGGYGPDGEPLHPEPDFSYIGGLINLNRTGDFDIVSAWDADVDRRLDGGSGFFIESADEFALFAKYINFLNLDSLFKDTVYFCRSTVTADPADRMQSYLEKQFPDKTVKTVETPTGFKWIAELGNWGVEESNGVGNPYLREKDGIFSTVFLLKIILETGKNPRELMEELWSEYGRVYFTRGEISGTDNSEKEALTRILSYSGDCTGQKYGSLTLESAGAWDYIHPVTGKKAAENAAWVLNFSEGNTIKARFSGTGSGGYTLRVYCSKYDKKYNIPKSEIVMPMRQAFDAFLAENNFNKKSEKYIDTDQPDIYR